MQGIIGKRTVVELRNENCVTGRIESVDDCMNTSMSNVTFKTLNGQETRFTHFYIQGKNIRYIQIPDDINMMKTIKTELNIFKGKREKGVRESNKVRKEMRKQKRKDFLLKKTLEMKNKLARWEARNTGDPS